MRNPDRAGRQREDEKITPPTTRGTMFLQSGQDMDSMCCPMKTRPSYIDGKKICILAAQKGCILLTAIRI